MVAEAKVEPIVQEKEDIPVDDVAWTKKDERRIRRKLDLRVMPVIFVLYLFSFIDR